MEILLVFAIIAMLFARSNIRAKGRRIDELTNSYSLMHQRAEAAESDASKLRTKHSEAARRIYARAEEKANQIVSKAKEERIRAASHLAQAKRTLQDAEREAAKLARTETKSLAKELSEATREADKARNDLAAFMKRAHLHANQMIAEARRKADHLVGPAALLNEDVAALRATCAALRRQAEGYASVSPMPFVDLLSKWGGLLDGTKASAKLGEVRNLIEEQVRLGIAVRCDKPNEGQCRAAMSLLRGSFDAEVDRILLRVKTDNFNPLAAELRDRFVSINGMASTLGAEVTETYLRLRIQEVAAACAIHGLKEEAREEQRRLREEAKEEERVRREADEARRQAEREEVTARNAVEEVRREMARAADADRERLEARLVELQSRLSDAEARGQRAVSLAQQTRSGHVYVISNVGSFGEDVYKIGMTRRFDPSERVRELGDASVPFEFDIHGMIYSSDAPALEKELHRRFEERRVNAANPRKEFFRVQLSEIEQAVQDLGVETIRWTRAAAATQWRESLELVRRTSSDPGRRTTSNPERMAGQAARSKAFDGQPMQAA